MFYVRGNFYIWILFLGVLFSAQTVKGEAIILINDESEKYFFRGSILEIFEDETHTWTFEDISSPGFADKFEINNTDVPKNEPTSSAFWVRFKVKNAGLIDKQWLIELYDYKINKFELYVPDGNGNYLKYVGGDSYPFSHKQYKHKNFVFDIPNPSKKEQYYYIKIDSRVPVSILGVIRTQEKFAEYASTEYYFLALFYGIVLAMFIYNLFLYFTIKDNSYIFYVLYVAFVGLYGLCNDGTGFQYLWPDSPWFNLYAQKIFTMFMTIWVLLYAQSFLNTKDLLPRIHVLIYIAIVIRVVIFVTSIFNISRFFKYYPYEDLIFLLLPFIAGILSYRKGFYPSKYFLLGFTFLFIGYFIRNLEEIGILSNSILTVYSFNFGAVLQMLLLSMALGEKIKSVLKEKEYMQMEKIRQLQEKEILKDNLNKELELRVYKRTKELNEKNKQLDSFVYKAAHDIKGPIKTLIGISSLASKDLKEESALDCLDKVKTVSLELDKILAEVTAVCSLKDEKSQFQKINFRELIAEIMEEENINSVGDIRINIDVNQDRNFFSERKSLKELFRILLKNLYTCKDLLKADPYINIKVKVDKKGARVEIVDNGEEIKSKMSKENEGQNGYQTEGTLSFIASVEYLADSLGARFSLSEYSGKGNRMFLHF